MRFLSLLLTQLAALATPESDPNNSDVNRVISAFQQTCWRYTGQGGKLDEVVAAAPIRFAKDVKDWSSTRHAWTAGYVRISYTTDMPSDFPVAVCVLEMKLHGNTEQVIWRQKFAEALNLKNGIDKNLERKNALTRKGEVAEGTYWDLARPVDQTFRVGVETITDDQGKRFVRMTTQLLPNSMLQRSRH